LSSFLCSCMRSCMVLVVHDLGRAWSCSCIASFLHCCVHA
jgi:hypothetical protein